MKGMPGAATLPTYRVVGRLIRANPGSFGAALLLSLAVFGLPIPLGLVTRAFFDALTARAPAGAGVGGIIVLFALTEAGGVLAGAGLSFAWGSLLQSGMALLRRNLLREVLRAPTATAGESSGAALSRFRDDVEEVVESIDAWLDLAGRSVTVAAALVIMLRIDVAITVAAFVPLAFGVVTVNQARGPIAAYRLRSREALARALGFLTDLLGAVQAIEVAGATPRAIAHLHGLNERRRRAALRDFFFGGLLDGFNLNIVNLGTGVILLMAARAMRANTFTVGDFALFVTYMEALTWFGDEISRWLLGYKQAGISVGRLTTLMPESPPTRLVALEADRAQQPSTAPPSTPFEVLEVRALTYRHPGSGRGIVGVDLRVERGELVVVTGRLGAGKSTLLQALLGLVVPDSGEVRWNGVGITDPRQFLVPPRVAYTPQAPRLFSESLQANILLGLPPGSALARALHSAVLEPDVARLERGLETVIGPRGVKLSGGQVQRTAAARMFIREPELLVVDDLSSALDVETERQLWERLAARPGISCLAVSHRPTALRRASRVIVLEAGRVVAEGRLVDLLATSAAMRRLWAEEANPAPV